MVVTAKYKIQTSCILLSELHSIMIWCPTVLNTAISSPFSEKCDHSVVGYLQLFRTPYANTDFRFTALSYSLVRKLINVSYYSEYKFAWDKLGPFSMQFITDLSAVCGPFY